MISEKQANVISQLVAKCLADEVFKQKLIVDPVATLEAAGFPDPSNIQASTEFKNAIIMLIHSITGEGELSDLMLDNVAGAGSNSGSDF
jgi:hypothetical protein